MGIPWYTKFSETPNGDHDHQLLRIWGSSLQLNQLGFFRYFSLGSMCKSLSMIESAGCVLSKVKGLGHARNLTKGLKRCFLGLASGSPLSRHCGRWDFKFLDVIGVWSIWPCTPYLDDCKAINYIYTYLYIHIHMPWYAVASICHFSWWDIPKRNHLQRHSWPGRWLVFL